MENSEIYNVWAVGRNYQEHVHEMKSPRPDQPIFFLKPGSAVIQTPLIHLPPWAHNVHHEIELVLQFGKNLQIQSWGLALDLTERTLQAQLKEKGLPWSLSKCFPESCPISPLKKLENLTELKDIDFELQVNSETRQKGRTSEMIFPIPYLVEYTLKHFPVKPHDLLLTGTPSGVGKLNSKDHLKALVNGASHFEWTIA